MSSEPDRPPPVIRLTVARCRRGLVAVVGAHFAA